MYFEISVKIGQYGSQQKSPWKYFSLEWRKGLINSFSISKLVIIGEKIVKIHQKMAKIAENLKNWPPEGFGVKNNYVLYHFGVWRWCRTSFVYKKLVSTTCLHFRLMWIILSPETHTSEKLKVRSYMSKNSVLYHFGIREQSWTNFVYKKLVSAVCIHFWLMSNHT